MTEQMALFYAEEWRPVVGWEGFYEVSDQGRVRSVERVVTRTTRWGTSPQRVTARILSPAATGRARHLCVRLSRPGNTKTRLVHQLVLESFVGPRPKGRQGLHWNDESSDNRLRNLRWGTPSANGRDAVRNGRNKNSNKTHCLAGHEFTAENTWIRPSGGRDRRECNRLRSQEWRNRQQQRAA